MDTMTTTKVREIDLAETTLRALNDLLQARPAEGMKPLDDGEPVVIRNARGAHAVAVGMDHARQVQIEGSVGYYAAAMNKQADVMIHGSAGTAVAENIMSGSVRVSGNASQSAGATGNGGLLVIEGDAAARCGISMKGVDIVVGGSIGHMSAFMAQSGRLVVRGDAGEALGDSIYEARIYVRGNVASLGADCVAKEMRQEHVDELREVLERAGYDDDPSDYTRYGSARKLYNFHIDNHAAY